MSPEEQRIAIAESVGWKFELEDSPGMLSACANAKDPEGFDHQIMFHPFLDKHAEVIVPDYPGDLNAMHEAEKSLNLNPDDKNGHYWRYQLALSEVVNAKERNKGPIAIIRATAAQRAEAYLRTIGKWKD